MRGDVVVAVDGKKTDGTAKLRSLIAGAGPDKTVELRVLRQGKEKSVKVTLGQLPTDATLGTKGAGTKKLSGLSLGELTAQTRAFRPTTE